MTILRCALCGRQQPHRKEIKACVCGSHTLVTLAEAPIVARGHTMSAAAGLTAADRVFLKSLRIAAE
jgi:hypothetical protein